MVEPPEAISRFFKGYTNFSGRSSRAEYWWPQLALFLLMALLGGLLEFLGADTETGEPGVVEMIIVLPMTIFLLAIVVPMIALMVRRLHDMNLSGLVAIPVYLVGAIPLIGLIGFIVVGSISGTDGPNKYGPPST